MKSPQQKGKLLENFITEELRQSGLDPRAYPQRGSGNGKNKGDIWNALDLHFECKNHNNGNIKQWKKQMKEENVSHLQEVLIWHLPGTSLNESTVIIDWEYFKALLLGNKGSKPIFENPKLKYPLLRLKDLINSVLKELPN